MLLINTDLKYWSLDYKRRQLHAQEAVYILALI